MSAIRSDPKLRDLAEFAAHFSQHQDIAELHRRGQALVAEHEGSADLAELAATYVDNAEHRKELLRSASEVLAKPAAPMRPARRAAIGVYLTVLGLLLLAATPHMWSLATQVMTSQSASQVSVWGLDFEATPEMALMAIVILMGLIGSVTVMTLVFALRAGNGTLEDSFAWWYVTRPITAAGLAVLFYVTATAGLLDLGAISDASALVIAAALAALAGLFTDHVLEKMRGMLGLLPFHEPASGKKPRSRGK
jgi:hypothetical protein